MINFCITFKQFPLPPSSNQMYSSVRGRLIKSKEARLFDQRCENWAFQRKSMIEREKSRLEAIRANKQGFKVTCLFVFSKKRLIGQKGQLKRLDASNRLKACHDAFARIIGIDDSLFISGEFEKLTCESVEQEQVIITLEPASLRAFESL